MPSPRLSKAKRDQLLAKLRAGHDLEAAAGALGLSDGQIEVARDKYAKEIAAAFRTGTAKLRSKIMESALSEDNAAVLMKLLEQRTAAQEPESNPGGIDLIERVIILDRCEYCGKRPSLRTPGPLRHSSRLEKTGEATPTPGI